MTAKGQYLRGALPLSHVTSMEWEFPGVHIPPAFGVAGILIFIYSIECSEKDKKEAGGRSGGGAEHRGLPGQ